MNHAVQRFGKALMNESGMRMPSDYTDVDAEELTYEGGWINLVVGIGAIIFGCAANVAADYGLISRGDANAINVVCTVVGVASGVGGIIGTARGMDSAGANATKASLDAARFCKDVGMTTYDSASLVGAATGKM